MKQVRRTQWNLLRSLHARIDERIEHDAVIPLSLNGDNLLILKKLPYKKKQKRNGL